MLEQSFSLVLLLLFASIYHYYYCYGVLLLIIIDIICSFIFHCLHKIKRHKNLSFDNANGVILTILHSIHRKDMERKRQIWILLPKISQKNNNNNKIKNMCTFRLSLCFAVNCSIFKHKRSPNNPKNIPTNCPILNSCFMIKHNTLSVALSTM